MQAKTGVRQIIASLAFMSIMLPVLAVPRFTGGAITLPGKLLAAQEFPTIPLPTTPNFNPRSPMGPREAPPTKFYTEEWLDGFPLGASYLEVMNKKYIFGDIVMDGNGGVPTQIGPSLDGIDDILKMFKFVDATIDYTKLPLPPVAPLGAAPAAPGAVPAAPAIPPMPDAPIIPNPLEEKYIFAYDRQNDDNSIQWKTYVLFRFGRVVGIVSRIKNEPTSLAGQTRPPKERLWLKNDIGFNYQMAEMATRRNMGWPDMPGASTASIDNWYYLYYDKWNFALTISAATRMVIGVSIGDKLMAIPQEAAPAATDTGTAAAASGTSTGPAPVPPIGAQIVEPIVK